MALEPLPPKGGHTTEEDIDLLLVNPLTHGYVFIL